MQKQIPGLKGQINIIARLLNLHAGLEANAAPYKADAIFPVRMTARAVGLCLAESKRLLVNARTSLTTELDFYLDIDRRIEALSAPKVEIAGVEPDGKEQNETQAPGEPDQATRTAAVEALNKEAANREADTAGEAVFAMQSLPAALTLMAKAIENDRTYRAGPNPEGKPHKQVPGLMAQINIFAALDKLLKELEQNVSEDDASKPFPVRMTAEAGTLNMSMATILLFNAASMLKIELEFYLDAGRQADAIQQCDCDDASKASLLDKLNQSTSSREPLTAGRAVFAMQSIPAALAYMAKLMENDRDYRA